MKTSNLLLLIFFIIFTIFGMVGALMIGNIFHELKHFEDYSDKYNVSEVCMLADPLANSNKSIFENAGAFVLYNYDRHAINMTEAQETSDNSENSAYLITGIIYAIFLISLIWVWYNIVVRIWK